KKLMDEKESQSSWDSLVESLGVQPDSEAFERRQPKPVDLPPTVAEREAAAERATPHPQPSDWESLASSLGIEPAEPADEPSEAELSSTTPQRHEPAPAAESRGPDSIVTPSGEDLVAENESR